MVGSRYQHLGCGTKDILPCGQLLYHYYSMACVTIGMDTNANDFGNAHPYLKWLVKLFAVCQENIQPMSMCFCVPEEWLMRGSLAPMYFTKTRRERCVCLSAAIKAVNGHL